MKRILQTAAFALLIALGGSWQNTASAQPGYDGNEYGDDAVSYQAFYDELSPHGRWIDYPEYGYVWAPNNITGFRPYETGGRWVWTDDYEWMWVSDYSWGWAPFHYGRWFHDPFYGWMWMPGYEWAPAWVAWRDGGDYYGWAPLRPGFNIGINISIGSYNPPVDYWCFAPRRYISSPRIYDYCLDRGRNVTIINNTTIINNYGRRNNVFYNGPRRADAERYTGRINPVRFRESSGPGRTQFRNNEVSVYRPRVRNDNNRQFRPGNFDRYERNAQANNTQVRGNRDNNNGNNGNNLPGRANNNRFERRNNNEAGQQQPGNTNNRRLERRNDRQTGTNRTDQRRREVINRNNNNNNGAGQQPGNNNNNRRFERRNVTERNQNAAPPQNRQETRNNNRFERQPSQQTQRPQQRQPSRQFENRSGGGNNPAQRSGGNGNTGRERRNTGRRG